MATGGSPPWAQACPSQGKTGTLARCTSGALTCERCVTECRGTGAARTTLSAKTTLSVDLTGGRTACFG
ncbi:hypothetical protein GCM10010319_59630 [Streptomyces blastmyceticus]|uniref:Uncharacterized protein n=1 Tax=Streptomyces blastmyceticus TaxID=68180 RepID=A0ABN0XUN1_9ACTN